MNSETVTFVGGLIFDGQTLLRDHCAVFSGGMWANTVADSPASRQGKVVNLEGDILSVGYTDLQVNGGGGTMLNDDPSVECLKRIASAHRSLGTTSLLPTLITDTREITQAAINATIQSIYEGVAGIDGLHLEGPHLSIAKKGAHDKNLIRSMDSTDLKMLLKAAQDLPALLVTIAPENVSVEQVHELANAGVIVSLGHTDAAYDTCVKYHRAGARCVTHLYNAMSQLGSREPGLVGAAIDRKELFIGLIADGHHVHPAAIRAAWSAKATPDSFYLVSDAMATAASSIQSFELNGRTIYRRDGRLTLADGTLAGADLDLTFALKFMHEVVGIDLATVLRATTTVPNRLLGRATDCHGLALQDIIRIKGNLESASPVISV